VRGLWQRERSEGEGDGETAAILLPADRESAPRVSLINREIRMAVVWGMPEYHVPRLSGSHRMAVTRGSVLFDDARAQTLSSDPHRSDFWVGSVVLPVTTDEECEAVLQLRGWVRVMPPARATLFASIGPCRMAVAFDDQRDEAIVREATFSLTPGTHSIGITLLLQVEGLAASLSIDTVDVALSRTSPDVRRAKTIRAG
jgi:hypothetical protein